MVDRKERELRDAIGWFAVGFSALLLAVVACNENPAEVIVDVDVPPCDSTCPPQLPPDTVTVTLTDTLVVTVADTTRIYCWVTDENANTGNPEYSCDDGTVGPSN